jgi:hypothetical protein
VTSGSPQFWQKCARSAAGVPHAGHDLAGLLGGVGPGALAATRTGAGEPISPEVTGRSSVRARRA